MTALYGLAATEWPILVTLLAIFGTSLFALVFAPGQSTFDLTATLTPAWRWLAAINLALYPITIVIEGANLAGVQYSQVLPLMGEVLADTHAGRLWLWRIPIAIALIIAVSVPAARRFRAIAACVLSAALLLIQSLAGHAIDHGALSVAIYFIHELAAGTWIGALVAFFLASIAQADPRWLERAAHRVSTVAGAMVAILILSGAWNAFEVIGAHPHLLIDSLYGRTLLWKLAAVAVVLLMGAWNRFRVIPTVASPDAQSSLARNVGFECLILIVVLGITALLANSPPPH